MGIVTGHRQQQIVIVGGGTAGWMAAAALARFTDRAITLVESADIGTVGVGEATIPQIRLFNAGLGIDQAEFLRETKGSFKLGIEFAGWAGEGSAYMHAFGHIGQAAGIVPFHHLWLRAQSAGMARPLGSYSLNETAARRNAMQMWRADPARRTPDMPWAYHFDAGLYAAFLRRYCEARSVKRIEATVSRVVKASDGAAISAIELADGRHITGDFFIDCTGFRSLLLGEALGSKFDDWTHWLPCDRAIAVPCAAQGDFTPYTQSTARPAGWQWRIPLQHRTGNGHVYCSAFMNDQEAERILLSQLGGEPLAEPKAMRFAAGMRPNQWVGNCLAIGLAAGFMEPLESTSIHLIQSAIARFLAMLPAAAPQPVIVAEYNRQARFEWTRIRDFLILHYWANGRTGEPFWDRCRAMELPDTLQAKIDQFRAGGFVHREHDELFTEPAWVQVMIGQGIVPETWHPVANVMPAQQLARMLTDIEQGVGGLVAAMPGHAEFLRALCTPDQTRAIA